ncbi:MAG: M28 family peptidase [Gemmatimonadales bacterium]|jgi:N-acetylated-alpha-linked acidic dipeptidase|nr:M28 family peptidase [Gemmatimonadales bacterium]MDG2239021.1 M28 family peptidase [Longimicrobiales bacterium]MBT6696129.1 M28 family peptidase [Gemmatimonadales bacterium]MBT6889123.1 M28 family peptidase [Gemmatimonadales bacterium]MBT7126474.1 M28 family peptidase [Gemmatimonadales bacterium]
MESQLRMPSLVSRSLFLFLALTAARVLPGVVQAASAQNSVEISAPVGFTAESAARQSYCEAKFVGLPSGDSFREHLRIITANPHPTGSPEQVEVGHYLSRVMRAAGLSVRDHPYDVYLPQLTDDVEAQIVTPVSMRLNNREPALPEDRFSGHPDLLNGWNAFSGSGDVTGEVVYANYGTRADYRALDSMGISLEGKIVVARYGGNFRGFKVLFAEERGAAGVIMFNDAPAVEEDPYPQGPMLNGEIIQRGSVLTLAWTGDPLTPFEPALPVDGPVQVNRLDPDDVGLHTIPVLPLGYTATSEILSRMTGEMAPGEWQGGLPMPYRLTGGDELTVRVRVNQPKALTRATMVVGTLEGSDFPDEWMILGAHYDPWGFGAVDPNGGTAMLLTLAEALGELAEEGCRPRRSILIAHWDAEEYGVIGSTEWVEEFLEPLTTGAVAYINADAAVSGGFFGGSASPSLKQPILDAIRDTPYPKEGRSVYDWWAERSEGGTPVLGDLGGGSDHIAFYTHAGIPSAGITSGAGGRSGVAHSNYDNFSWFERFGDPEWIYGPMVATVDGLLSLRLANADLLPYDVTRYAVDTRMHVNTLLEVAEYRRIEVDLSRLVTATTDLARAATALDAARSTRVALGPVPSVEAERINAAFIGLEKAWLDDRGLQDRPWSRSLYVSPDPFSGYASWMLPGLRYEIETDDPADVPEWETRYLEAIRRLTDRMDGVTALIEGSI